MNADSARHAADFLRATDRERYLTTLLLKPPVREAVQALYAFNADVASVRERAREPAPGEIRLQWWADALRGEGHGAVRQNPLADALLGAIADFRLPSGVLLRLIAARRFDLYDDPMPDMPSFEGYAGETASVLFQLAAMILNAGEPVETGDAAGHLGVAQALTGHLRAFGLNASRGRLVLPLTVFAANGVRETEIVAGQATDGVRAARAQLIDLARDHLLRAERAVLELPRRLRPAFATIALLPSQLRDLERQSATPYASPRDRLDWQKILALTLWGMRNG